MRPRRNALLIAAAVASAVVTLTVSAGRTDADPTPAAEHHFARERVLGTSFDLTVVTDDRATAERCLDDVLGAIDAACVTLSTYDAESEISRINARPDAAIDVPLSPLLAGVLRRARAWQRRSEGAFDPTIAPLVELWRVAETRGRAPTDAELAPLLASAEPRFAIEGTDPAAAILRRAQPCTFRLDAIAKGTIIDLALAAARAVSPRVTGLCLNIGGDIGTWGMRPGGRPWEVGIADPGDAAENAPPRARVALAAGQAVATSGGSARFWTIDGRRFSHLLDPRTGRSVDHVASASVVAPDAETADVLATILTVLPIDRGIALVDDVEGAACLVVERDGAERRSARWIDVEVPVARRGEATPTATGSRWDEAAKVEVAFTLVDSATRGRFHRHFVAVWVVDEHGRLVKIVALWAKRGELKYLKKLNKFWGTWKGSDLEKAAPSSLKTLSRATRRPGEYTVVWDGTDQAGRRVAPGNYTIHVDVNREHGPGKERHTHAGATLDCGASSATAKVADQPELTGVSMTYTPGRRAY